MKDYGYLDRVRELLQKNGVPSVVFDRILPNPLKSHVMEGAALARAEGCDFVVGLGGGSSIDSAKSIAVMAANDGDYWDYIHGGTGKGMPVLRAPLPVVAITTTAGTGTEADPFTVITKEETGEKIGFGCDGTFPVISIVDPDLMTSVARSSDGLSGIRCAVPFYGRLYRRLLYLYERYVCIESHPADWDLSAPCGKERGGQGSTDYGGLGQHPVGYGGIHLQLYVGALAGACLERLSPETAPRSRVDYGFIGLLSDFYRRCTSEVYRPWPGRWGGRMQTKRRILWTLWRICRKPVAWTS